jgi:hypothetical protein
MTTPRLELEMPNGERIPLFTCLCQKCENIFFVQGRSQEYLPDYCCYCGTKFGDKANRPIDQDELGG